MNQKDDPNGISFENFMAIADMIVKYCNKFINK